MFLASIGFVGTYRSFGFIVIYNAFNCGATRFTTYTSWWYLWRFFASVVGLVGRVRLTFLLGAVGCFHLGSGTTIYGIPPMYPLGS